MAVYGTVKGSQVAFQQAYLQLQLLLQISWSSDALVIVRCAWTVAGKHESIRQLGLRFSSRLLLRWLNGIDDLWYTSAALPASHARK
jgi:hypothetical protein